MAGFLELLGQIVTGKKGAVKTARETACDLVDRAHDGENISVEKMTQALDAAGLDTEWARQRYETLDKLAAVNVKKAKNDAALKAIPAKQAEYDKVEAEFKEMRDRLGRKLETLRFELNTSGGFLITRDNLLNEERDLLAKLEEFPGDPAPAFDPFPGAGINEGHDAWIAANQPKGAPKVERPKLAQPGYEAFAEFEKIPSLN